MRNLFFEKVFEYFNFCVIKFLFGWEYLFLNLGGGGWYLFFVGLYLLFVV